MVITINQNRPADLCALEDKQLEYRSTMMILVVGFMAQRRITGEDSIIREVVITMLRQPLTQETRMIRHMKRTCSRRFRMTAWVATVGGRKVEWAKARLSSRQSFSRQIAT